MTTYSRLLIYYAVEHIVMILVFCFAAIVLFDEVEHYKRYHFLAAKKIDSIDDSGDMLRRYRMCVHRLLERLTMKCALHENIGDEWLRDTILSFCCGDEQSNVLQNREILEMLEQSLEEIEVVVSDGRDSKDGNEEKSMEMSISNSMSGENGMGSMGSLDSAGSIARVPSDSHHSMDDEDDSVTPRASRGAILGLSNFCKRFNDEISATESHLVVKTNKDIKSLITIYLKYC